MKYINKHNFLVPVLILTLFITLTVSYASNIQQDISNSVLRLHILANSNSESDQALKFKVRDRIINEAGSVFQAVSSPNEAVRIASENLAKFKQIAEAEIKRQGFSYPVNVYLGNYPFPTKSYGDITLPSGSYKALRVEIGNAEGENWWCVMYPPLCFTDGVLSLTSSAKEQLKDNLTDSEYKLITKEQSGAIPVEIRFKIVELVKSIF